jgi:hypothetical protein
VTVKSCIRLFCLYRLKEQRKNVTARLKLIFWSLCGYVENVDVYRTIRLISHPQFLKFHFSEIESNTNLYFFDFFDPIIGINTFSYALYTCSKYLLTIRTWPIIDINSTLAFSMHLVKGHHCCPNFPAQPIRREEKFGPTSELAIYEQKCKPGKRTKRQISLALYSWHRKR